MAKHHYESEKEIREAFENGLSSGNLNVSFDESCMTSLDDLYETWKHDTLRTSKDDLSWDSDYHDDDLKDD